MGAACTVVVTRPQAEARRTAALLERCGHRVLIAPVLEIVPVPALLEGTADALVVTSRQAVRHAPPLPPHLAGLPCWTIGGATTDAARAAGWTVRGDGDGARAQLVAQVVAAGARAPLILAGADERGDLVAEFAAAGVTARRVIVYAARLVPALPADVRVALVADRVDWVLLFSPRSAAQWRRLAPQGTARLACLSPAVAAAAGAADDPGTVVAAQPDLAALLAAADLLCDKAQTALAAPHDREG